MEPNVQESIDPPELDATDRAMIEALVADGRLSVPALAERVGVSRATGYSRFDRLVDSGAITGFGARVAPEAIGLPVSALAFVTAEQGAWESTTEDLLATPGVQWIGIAAGTYDYVVLLRAASLAELRDVVLRELLALPGVRNTQTSVLLDEVRAPGAVL
ncbi:MAG: Lrp/AsnC family transcriptional regulator [Actinomycetota bacterium]